MTLFLREKPYGTVSCPLNPPHQTAPIHLNPPHVINPPHIINPHHLQTPQRVRETLVCIKRPRCDINGGSETEVTVTSKQHAQRDRGIEKIRGASH